MSEEIKIAKKRGRPKKVVEADTVVVIENSANDYSTAAATKTSRTKSSKSQIESMQETSTPKKRVIRQKAVETDDSSRELKGTSRVTRARKPAKETAKVVEASPAEAAAAAAAEDGLTSTSASISTPTPSSASPSPILTQATAFQDQREIDAPIKNPEKSHNSFSQNLRDVHTQAAAEHSITTESEPVPTNNTQDRLDLINTNLRNLANDVRDSSIDRVEISLDIASSQIQQHVASLTELQSAIEIKRRVFESEITQLDSRLIGAVEKAWSISTGIRQLHQDRREAAVQTLQSRLSYLTDNVQESLVELEAITRTRNQEQRHASIQRLQSRLHILGDDIAQSQITIQQLNLIPSSSSQSQIASTDMPPISTATSTTNTAKMQSRGPNPPTSTPTSTPPSTAPTSSSNSNQTPRPRPRPAQPPPRTNPNQQQTIRPPRPTEQTYDELKKNPNFRRLSRRWTGIIVGIPVIIVTSVVLFKQYQQTLSKDDNANLPGRRRGELIPDSTSK